ncbi:MAG: GAP1-N1 domain-containing protein [Gaiellaceae bacterium]
MSDPVPIDDRVIHQAIHGYRHGHQLLASSVGLDDEAADALAHNSDSAPNARAADGPYLTGYGVVGGRYVLARTWLQADAERPNTVVTRSLILPRTLPSGFSAQRLLDLLSPMSVAQVSGELPAIDSEEVIGEQLALSSSEASIGATYYRSKSRLRRADEQSRERIAVGVWRQLWMPARYGLNFCTAPGTDRFSRTPRPLLFESGQEIESLDQGVSEANYLVASDLEAPGAFREFVHFVGSGERAVGLMEPFAIAFDLLQALNPSVDAFSQLLEDYRGDEPRRLRRLKRRFFSFQREEPRWRVDPLDLIRALASGKLGSAVYASDASLERWLRRCWDEDPFATAGVLAHARADEHASPVGPRTASEGISLAFASEAPELITPGTLAIAARLNPGAASGAVWDRNETELWRSWAELGDQFPVPRGSVPTDGYEWHCPVGALRNDPTALSRLLRQYPEALDVLVDVVDANPLTADLSIDLTADAKKSIRDRLETPDAQLAGLARLADPDVLPRRLDLASWNELLTSGDDAVAATAYLAGRVAGPKLWETTTLAMAVLYRTLSGRTVPDAWSRLDARIRGRRKSPDRRARLVDDYSHLLRGFSDSSKRSALTLLGRLNPDAATAVRGRLESESKKPKAFNLFDPTTW